MNGVCFLLFSMNANLRVLLTYRANTYNLPYVLLRPSYFHLLFKCGLLEKVQSKAMLGDV